jgi:triacylglycerol lipase
MKPATSRQLQALGADLSPAMIQGTSVLMAALAAPRDPAVEVQRDRFYGSHPRHRLDVFRRGTPAGAPVLVYIHGGGFVMGDKTTAGSPFYDNVGQWAAQQGWIGVTATYRLAPADRWPCGPEDMGLIVGWLRENIGSLGGDPDAIFLMGQSAGAAHVAAYLGQARFHQGGSPGIAGALMLSGIYDPAAMPPNPFNAAYFGTDPAVLAEARSTPALVSSAVPMMFTVSEFDPRDFHDQAARLTQAWHQHNGRYPPMEYLAGYNHLAPAQTIGGAQDDLGPRIACFVGSACSGTP